MVNEMLLLLYSTTILIYIIHCVAGGHGESSRGVIIGVVLAVLVFLLAVIGISTV